MIRIALAAMTALLMCACFDTPRPVCAFRCGDDGECPTDYRCDDDGWCKLASERTAITCAPPVQDAAAPAPPADAAPDAGADAGADTQPDAGPDASVMMSWSPGAGPTAPRETNHP